MSFFFGKKWNLIRLVPSPESGRLEGNLFKEKKEENGAAFSATNWTIISGDTQCVCHWAAETGVSLVTCRACD